MDDYHFLITVFFSISYLLAFVAAIHVIMTVRSSQAAVAWLMGLFAFPYLAVILYAFFGRNSFSAYATAMRQSSESLTEQLKIAEQAIAQYAHSVTYASNPLINFSQKLNTAAYTTDNYAELLIDGRHTYEAIFKALEQAKNYILLQFYIVRSDHIGRLFKNILIRKASQGIKVYFLYDEWGSHSISKRYLGSLREAGVIIAAFHDATNSWRDRLRINFRNHRKIVVVDGLVAFIGGLNIGEEYVGRLKRFGRWRDTHLVLYGPSVQSVQLSFCTDWYWAQREALTLNWQVKPALEKKQNILILPSGPDKPLAAGALLITQLINLAKHQLWIATPYFVPDQTIITALQLAILRGVEVRILLPNRADHLLVYWCSFSFYNEMLASGVKLYRYTHGFMHQKIILVDDELASVGTVNLDNRSLYINFELTAVVADAVFVKQVHTMLKQDFAHSYQVKLEEYNLRPYWFRVITRLARLLAPLL